MTVSPPVPPEGRVTLVLTSPRSGVGLLTWAGWERLRGADEILAADPEPAWLDAFDEAGIELTDVSGLPIGERAGRLVESAGRGRELVWWGSPDGDPGLTDALAEHLSRRALTGRPPEIEVLTGSHDVTGARMLDLVAVLTTLRSPQGSAWDREQTHASLLPFLLEETHEVIEAIESRDRDHLVEELGDLLLQVVFHAEIGTGHEVGAFDIDDVAGGIVAKLVRRNPHVFGSADVVVHDEETSEDQIDDGEELSAADVERRWEELKAAEKPRRQGFDGIPATLPALARAQKMLDRLARTATARPGGEPVPETGSTGSTGSRSSAGSGAVAGTADPERLLDAAIEAASAGDELAALLLGAVRHARKQGLDAEAELRAALSRLPNP